MKIKQFFKEKHETLLENYFKTYFLISCLLFSLLGFFGGWFFGFLKDLFINN